MKVLFVTAKEATDHLSSCLYDGLQEILGEENVVDAVGHRLLHAGMCGETVYRGETDDTRFGQKDVLSGISGRREGRLWGGSEGGFGLLVLNAAFRREYDWAWARKFVGCLAPGGKVAYVEGWDSPHEVHPPEVRVDAVFRKEIDPAYPYPYSPHHLTFAAPARWFHGDDVDAPRSTDVFFSGNLDTHPYRRGAVAGAFQARRAQRVLAASKLDDTVPGYFNRLRQSKLVLCPAAADGADSLRTYEAVACGAVPLFVGYPLRRRDDWFSGKVFECATAGEVEAHVDAALARDLPAMRRELLAFAREKHTTRARAEKLLRLTGVTP